MKQAELFLEAFKQGMNPIETHHSLPKYELRYIRKAPVEVYRAALQSGWQVFPVSSSRRLIGTHANLFGATDNQHRFRSSLDPWPNWVLATRRKSGVFVVEVDGDEGLASLLNLCDDDWNWLETLRSVAGEKHYIFFAWPEGRRQISGSRQIGEGLSVRGEGDWVLLPPSRGPHGAQHSYLNPMDEVVAPPLWIVNRVFEPADTVDLSRPFPPCSVLRNAWSDDMADHAHD